MTPEQQKLVLDNQALAHAALRRLSRTYRHVRRLDYRDAIQQATIALIRAATHYKPSRGIRFSTYATRSIVNELLSYARCHLGVISLPMVKPTVRKNALRAQKAALTVPLDPRAAPLFSPDGQPLDAAIQKEQRHLLHSCLAELPPRQQEVMRLRLKGYGPSETAAMLHCSRKEVKNLIHSSVLMIKRRIRHASN